MTDPSTIQQTNLPCMPCRVRTIIASSPLTCCYAKPYVNQAEARSAPRLSGISHPEYHVVANNGDLYPTGRDVVSTPNTKLTGGPAGLLMNNFGNLAIAATDTERAR